MASLTGFFFIQYNKFKMKFLYNSPELRQRRKELRESSTEHEDLLWKYLCKKQLKNTKFYRQYSVGPYILDFYCPSQRLGIELDGNQHFTSENVKYDKMRSAFLKLNEINMLRFNNSEIKKDVFKVLEKIEKMLS
jgi:very-short-patch-repair endonuclease